MSSSDTKPVFDYLSQGEYGKVKQLLEKSPIVLKKDHACKVFYYCAVNCSKKKEIFGTIDDLKYILKWAKSALEEVNKQQLNTYLTGIINVITYLVKQNHITTLLDLEDVFIPNFLNADMSQQHKTYYESCCTMVHNELVRNYTKYEAGLPERISCFAMLMYRKINTIEEIIETKAVLYIKIFNIECKFNAYKQFLQLFDLSKCEDNVRLGHAIFTLLYVITLNLWYTNFKKIQELLKFTGECLKSIKPNNLISILNAVDKYANNVENGKKESSLKVIDKDLMDATQVLSEINKDLSNNSKEFDSNLEYMTHFISMVFMNNISVMKNQKLSNLVPFGNEVHKLLVKLPIKCICKASKHCNAYPYFKTYLNFVQHLCFTIENSNKHNEIMLSFNKSKEVFLDLLTAKCALISKVQEALFTQSYYFIYESRKTISKEYIDEVKSFLALIFHIEDLNKELFKKYFFSSITMLSRAYRQLNMFEEALMFIAFYISISNEKNEEFMDEWMSTKEKLNSTNNLEENDLKTKSLGSILEKNIDLIKNDIKPTFDLIQNVKNKLLIVELRTNCKQKDFCKEAVNELINLKPDEGYFKMIISSFIKIPYSINSYDNLLIEIAYKNLPVERKENYKFCDLNGELAFIEYIHYKIAERNRWSTEVSSIILEHHSEEISDINTRHKELQMKNYLQYTQILLNAFKSLVKHLKQYKPGCNLIIGENYSLLKLLLSMIYDFRVNFLRMEYMQACILYLEMGRLLKDSVIIVEAVTLLIDFANLKSEFVEKLLEEADSYLKNLKGNEVILNNYYLSKCRRLLELQKYQQSIAIYKKIDESKVSDVETSLRLITMKINLLLTPCSEKLPDHNNNLYKLLKEQRFSKNWINSEKGSLYFSLFFENAILFAEILFWLKLPKDTLLHLREMLLAATMLSNPIAMSYTYYFIGYAEILLKKMDSSRMKINGISYILELPSQDLIQTMDQLTDNLQNLNLSLNLNSKKLQNDDEIVKGFEDFGITLNNTYKKMEQPGSPSFHSAVIEVPDFANHSDECFCFACLNIDYQILMLSKLQLETFFNLVEKDLKVSEHLFNVSFKLYTLLRRKKDAFKTKIDKHFPSDVYPDFGSHFCDIVGTILLEGANHYLRNDLVDKAQAINKLLMMMLKESSNFNQYLYLEASEQKCYIMIELINIPKIRKIEQLEPEPLNKSADNEAHTPTKKVSKVVLANNIPEFDDIIKKKVRKPLKFDLNDCEDSLSNSVVVTPSISKIKIYSDTKQSSTRSRLTSKEKENLGAIPKRQLLTKPKSSTSSTRTKTSEVKEKTSKNVEGKLEKMKASSQKIPKPEIAAPIIKITNTDGETHSANSSSSSIARRRLQPENEIARRVTRSRKQ